MAKLRIIIKPDGTTTTKVEGVLGPSCTKAGVDIARALGKITEDIHLGDYYASADEGELKKRRVAVAVGK